MHAQWMPTGSEEEQKATKAKASTFLDHIQQGMTHDVNTHVHLGKLEDIVARLGEDPQDLVACIKTLMDHCEMINDEHCEHKLRHCIICAYCHKENVWPSHSRHPPMSWLKLLWTTSPSSMPGNKSPTAPNLWTQSARTKGRQPTPATAAMVIHHLHLQGLSQLHPTAPSWQSKLPSMWLPLFQMGHWGPKCCGGKPLQSRNAPPPGSQQRKSRCPPRTHNTHQGWKNKTDTIDVREDHSPQDEIALHHIQHSTTTQNTHPEEIMVGDVHAPQCNEAYTTIQLPASASRKGTASLRIKVDTGAGGNVLPLHVFQCLYPDQISPAGLPTGLDHVNTRLTVYNGSHIPLYGALWGPITWQPDCPGARPHRVKSYWYIADTPGPTILGLPSSEKLAVVKMNCAITVRQPCTHPVSTTVATNKPATAPEAAKPIRSTDDLINEFLDRFKGIGRFPSEYKIWLHHDAHPVIHAPRKCPITLHPKVKEHLDKMECLGVITCVDEPTDWVSLITYVQKANGELCLCLDQWPQWGHLPWSWQDTNCRRSCSQVCTLPLLH